MSDEKQIQPQDGGVAVGAYLRYLREAKKISAVEMGERIETNQAQIWRIDNWKSDTRSTLLFKYIYEVEEDANDVLMLINNPKATKDDGEKLAKLRLAIKKH